MKRLYPESSHEYAVEVEMWCERFETLMKEELYAPVAIVAYSLPHQNTMVGCPLGDPEYQELGEGMRTNSAMFAAAERTGLLAEGLDAFFYAALDNAGSWSGYADDIKYVLENDTLCKYVSFSDRYNAECLLAGGEMLCDDENEDIWLRVARAAQKKLDSRKTRGYAY